MPATFASLGVPTRLIAPLTQQGINAPFPIQTATLPDTLDGRDVLGRGRTGSGKTLAFSLPLVARLAGLVPGVAARPSRPGAPRGLVLAPTRELANQILATIEPLAVAAGLRVMTIFGGVSQAGQVRQLRRGVDIVVATPGRLEDLMGQGEVRLDAVAITVLDEADHMADLGFLPGVTRILAATPAGTQRMLFSATLDGGIDKLVKRFLNRPLEHSVDAVSSPVAAMTHHVLLVADPGQKRQVVRELAAGTERRLLFTRTKHQARKLARELTADGIPAVELHGNLSQNARERGLKAFADGQVRVMVATDIAARGIHVDDVELVVHVDPPAEHKAYLHRSGRTARAGQAGDVVTLVLPEQRKDFQSLSRAAKISVAPVSVRPGDEALRELAGPVAATVALQDAPAAAARRGEPRPAPQSSASRGNRNRKAGSGRSGSAAAGAARPAGSRARQGQARQSRSDSASGGAVAFSRQAHRRGGSRRAA
ncbi:MAG: DEAD/DEAH box helicase [Propionicimonas sp.]|nr:DEAD/DEAH box helicase [Propionicimonas sp.]